MVLREIATERVVVSANSTAVEELYHVPPGRRLHLRRIQVHFPVGTQSELKVRFLKGWIAIAPTDGYLVGDDVVHVLDVDEYFGSQSAVRGEFVNTSTLNQRECIVTLIGELE